MSNWKTKISLAETQLLTFTLADGNDILFVGPVNEVGD